MPTLTLDGRIVFPKNDTPDVIHEGAIVAEQRGFYDSQVKYHFRGTIPEGTEKYEMRKWAFNNLQGSFVIKADLLDMGINYRKARTYGIYFSREEDMMAWKLMWL